MASSSVTLDLSNTPFDSIAVVGPTACGKTRRAVEIARACGGEILSADSRQIYRGMDIGSGKDLEEYEDIPYHLIDIADAGSRFDLHKYLSAFHLCYDDVLERKSIPVICGGSGMYVENALRGIRLPDVPENTELRELLKDKSLAELTEILKSYKELHNKTDVDTEKRAIRAIEICEYYKSHPEKAEQASYNTAKPLNTLVIGLDIDRESRRSRITERLRQRLENGMVEEIQNLIKSGIDPEDLIYYGLEYKFVTLYVSGQIGYDEMFKSLETAIHQFAKRQMTWFRGMEKRGTHIHWLPYDLPTDTFLTHIHSLLHNYHK